MKIITYNIRGLGRGLKWALIRKLVKKERADMLCLQETKREMIDKKVCQALWGDSDASWELQPACNSAGGLLCIWNEETFKLENKLIGNGSIYLEGIWLTDGGKVMIVNIYLSCDAVFKRNLWEQIRHANMGGLWCIIGDFNCI